MACFSGFVYELPSISFNVFNIKVIRSAIRVIIESNSFSSNKMFMVSGDNMFSDNMNINKFGENGKDNLVLMQNGESSKVTAGRERRFKSAGVRALYGDPGNRNLVGIPEDRSKKEATYKRNRYDNLGGYSNNDYANRNSANQNSVSRSGSVSLGSRSVLVGLDTNNYYEGYPFTPKAPKLRDSISTPSDISTRSSFGFYGNSGDMSYSRNSRSMSGSNISSKTKSTVIMQRINGKYVEVDKPKVLDKG
jgi:hypothetical protein